MDPLTHGLLGAALARSTVPKSNARLTLAGGAGAMAPDLDIFIQSVRDPLLFFEFHRHFSHSLIFIPGGGALSGLLVWLLLGRKGPLKNFILAATLGYATHPFLDACTSYGTLLFWPFSEKRVAWDLISIVDPVFTLALGLGLILTAVLKRRAPVLLALLFCLSYLSFGAYQHQQGLENQIQLARLRGQEIDGSHRRLMPSLGNLLVWRSIYEKDGKFFVDGLRRAPFSRPLFWEGGSLPLFREAELSPPPGPILAKDLHRYTLFADSFLVRLPGENGYSVGDARYSGLPQGLSPIWGIHFDPISDRHVEPLRFPPRLKRDFPFFWEMVKGEAPGSRPL